MGGSDGADGVPPEAASDQPAPPRPVHRLHELRRGVKLPLRERRHYNRGGGVNVPGSLGPDALHVLGGQEGPRHELPRALPVRGDPHPRALRSRSGQYLAISVFSYEHTVPLFLLNRPACSIPAYAQFLLPLGKVATTIYGCLGALVFSGYIIYDTDNLIKRHSYDEYVLAAISLYLDVINIFMYIVTCLTSSD
jgi:hypothetical protein